MQTKITNRCLGRKAVVHDSRTLRMANYIHPEVLPPPPVARQWSQGKQEWKMLLNDVLGCCTIAGVAHMNQVWSLNNGLEDTILEGSVLEAYEKWCGYVLNNPATDRGGILLNVLKKFQQETFQGNSIIGFAAVNTQNIVEVRQAIEIFGCIYTGVQLPMSAQEQINNGEMWDVVNDSSGAPGSWGGHCVAIPDYDQDTFSCITWGAMQKMTTDFWLTYFDEAYVAISREWIRNRTAPNGLNLEQLTKDISEIT